MIPTDILIIISYKVIPFLEKSVPQMSNHHICSSPFNEFIPSGILIIIRSSLSNKAILADISADFPIISRSSLDNHIIPIHSDKDKAISF